MHVSEYLKTTNLQITVGLRGIQFPQDKALYKYGHFKKKYLLVGLNILLIIKSISYNHLTILRFIFL